MNEEITLTDAGILAGLESYAMRRLMMRGAFGPPRRDARQWYVSRAAFNAWLAQRATPATR